MVTLSSTSAKRTNLRFRVVSQMSAQIVFALLIIAPLGCLAHEPGTGMKSKSATDLEVAGDSSTHVNDDVNYLANYAFVVGEKKSVKTESGSTLDYTVLMIGLQGDETMCECLEGL